MATEDSDFGEVVWEGLSTEKPDCRCVVQQRSKIQDIMWRKGMTYKEVVRICREVSGKQELHGVGEVSFSEAELVIKRMEGLTR